MRLHQAEKLPYGKRSTQQAEDLTDRMGKISVNYATDKGLIFTISRVEEAEQQ